jgi:hypothetical protein
MLKQGQLARHEELRLSMEAVLKDILYEEEDVEIFFPVARLLARKMRQMLKDLGGCDHSVGICYCSLITSLDYLETAIQKIKGEKTGEHICSNCKVKIRDCYSPLCASEGHDMGMDLCMDCERKLTEAR